MNTDNDVVYDVIVIGAGLSGLSAAYRLKTISNSKLKVLVLEAKGEKIFFNKCWF